MKKNIKKKKKTKEVDKNRKKKRLLTLTIVCAILDVLAITCFFLAYGPIDYFRNLYVNTAMKTMNHQYLAYVFYSEKMVEKIMNSNYFIAVDEEVNLDDIVIDTSEKKSYKNKYDKEILTRDPGNDEYKIIDLKVGGSKAYLVAMYHPEKVKLISMETLGTQKGERIITMCERYGASVCINGGGFVDYGYGSGIPIGYVIENGKITWSDGDADTKVGQIVGITDEGKLLLLNGTGTQALEKGITSALQFGPFLIVNGKAMEVVGDPWGKAPRVAIAQRKDGVMLFLVIDGENYINGASLQEMIDTLLLYGAYNAANMDGGQSSTLIVNNQLYNNPPAAAKSTNGRYVVTGWGLIP